MNYQQYSARLQYPLSCALRSLPKPYCTGGLLVVQSKYPLIVAAGNGYYRHGFFALRLIHRLLNRAGNRYISGHEYHRYAILLSTYFPRILNLQVFLVDSVMDTNTAIKRLNQWDQQGRFVFTRGDLAKIFHDDSPRAFAAGLQRLVADEILLRPVRGVYVYALSRNQSSDTLEHIARALRRGEYNYVSLESALSEYGAISQIPMDRLTVMTTGRKGEYSTPFGTIEFTHTKRSPADILSAAQNVQRPLKLATPNAAWRDLKRVGRNTHLVDERELSTHGG